MWQWTHPRIFWIFETQHNVKRTSFWFPTFLSSTFNKFLLQPNLTLTKFPGLERLSFEKCKHVSKFLINNSTIQELHLSFHSTLFFFTDWFFSELSCFFFRRRSNYRQRIQNHLQIPEKESIIFTRIAKFTFHKLIFFLILPNLT